MRFSLKNVSKLLSAVTLLPSAVTLLPLAMTLCAVVSLVSPQASFAFGSCSQSMPKSMSYYPSLSQCGGNAGVILTDNLINSFSVVVRACDNGDRDPCFKNADSCGTNASSPYKVQKTVNATVNRDGKTIPAKIYCLHEPGTSLAYTAVRRITIKRVDPVSNPATDVLKICLPSRKAIRNPVKIVSTGRVAGVGNTGYSASCATQKYLGCNLAGTIQHLCAGR